MKRIALVIATAGIFLTLSVGPVRADVIYSNFGSGQSYDSSHSFIIAGSGTTVQQAVAFSFTPAANESFSSVTVPLSLTAGTGTVTVDLMTDVSGSPGSILESLSITGITSTNSLFVASSVTHPLLTSGTPYFIALFPGASNTNVAWFFNSTGATDAQISSDGGTTWQDNAMVASPALEVDGIAAASATPEPATLTLLGIGMVGMATYSWRRRKPAAA